MRRCVRDLGFYSTARSWLGRADLFVTKARRLSYLARFTSNNERGSRRHHFRASVQGAVRGSVLTLAAPSTSLGPWMHLSGRPIESGSVRWRGCGERDGYGASVHRYPCHTKKVEVKTARTPLPPPSWPPHSSLLAPMRCSHSAPFIAHTRMCVHRSGE